MIEVFSSDTKFLVWVARLSMVGFLAVGDALLSQIDPQWQSQNTKIAKLYQDGNLDAARQQAEQFLTQTEELYGKGHPYYAGALNNLATIIHQLGDKQKAERLWRRALEIKTKVWGKKHPRLNSIVTNLALLKMNSAAYDEAGDFLSMAVSQSPAVQLARARLMQYQGKYTQAQTLFKTIVARAGKNAQLKAKAYTHWIHSLMLAENYPGAQLVLKQWMNKAPQQDGRKIQVLKAYLKAMAGQKVSANDTEICELKVTATPPSDEEQATSKQGLFESKTGPASSATQQNLVNSESWVLKEPEYLNFCFQALARSGAEIDRQLAVQLVPLVPKKFAAQYHRAHIELGYYYIDYAEVLLEQGDIDGAWRRSRQTLRLLNRLGGGSHSLSIRGNYILAMSSMLAKKKQAVRYLEKAAKTQAKLPKAQLPVYTALRLQLAQAIVNAKEGQFSPGGQISLPTKGKIGRGLPRQASCEIIQAKAVVREFQWRLVLSKKKGRPPGVPPKYQPAVNGQLVQKCFANLGNRFAPMARRFHKP